MITKFTITGADDSVDVQELVLLQQVFPFVEWGILVSPKRSGLPRFPSKEWITELTNIEQRLDLSLHICGGYLDDLLKGNGAFLDEIGWQAFDRFQLNFHGQKHAHEEGFFNALKKLTGKEIIFQFDGVNTFLLSQAVINKINASALFDLSHGAGVLPEEGWPDPLVDIKCGYAGGLSPENLKDQIERIEQVAIGHKIWIDMETHVRSDSDRQFDLDKVTQCLKIGAEYIA